MDIKEYINDKFFQANKVLGLEILIQENGEERINYVMLSKKGNAISLEKQSEGEFNLENIPSEVENFNGAVVLSINGKGVMIKSFEKTDFSSSQQALERVFPGTNESDFFVQITKGVNNFTYVSFCRNDLLSRFRDHEIFSKLNIINIILGKFHFIYLLPLLSEKHGIQVIRMEEESIIFEEALFKENILENNENINSLQLDSINISQHNYSALASALSYFSNENFWHTNASLVQKSENLKYKKAFSVSLKAVLVSVLLIALINFYYFNEYFSQKSKLDAEVLVFQSSISNYNKLKTELDKQKQLVENSGMLIGSRNSFFVDRLVYDMPTEIVLNKIEVFPYKNKNQEDSIPSFESNALIIEGVTKESLVLNEWMKLINSKEFVTDLILDRFEQNKESSGGNFYLKVSLKN